MSVIYTSEVVEERGDQILHALNVDLIRFANELATTKSTV